MSSKGRIRLGFDLAGACCSTLRADKELLWFPAAALAASAVAVGLDVWAFGGTHQAFDGPVLWVALKSFPLVAFVHTVTVLSDAFVVAGARVRLAGGDPSLVRERRVVLRRLPTLVLFGFLRATERTISYVVSCFKQPGIWLSNLMDAAWDFATFLAVPVILYEPHTGPWRAVRRSAHLVRSRWGEQLVAQTTMGFAIFAVFLPVTIVAVVVGRAILGTAGIWIGVIGAFVAMDVVSAALTAVLAAAMYRFIVTGHESPGFPEHDLRGMFAEKAPKD